MFVRFFRQNQPIVLFALLPLVAVLWPGAKSLAAAVALRPEGMPLYRGLVFLCGTATWMLPVVAMLLVAGMAVQLNATLNGSDLYGRRNYLPALLFPLLLALFPVGMVGDPAMVGMPFVLWAVRRLWASQGAHRVIGPLFDAGLLIGMATLCYAPYAFLVVVFWSSISVMRPFHWREYLMPLLGALVLLGMVRGALYLFAPASWDITDSFSRPTTGVQFLSSPHWSWGVLLLLLSIGFVVATVPSFAAGYSRGVMREKNTRASLLAIAFTFGLLDLFAWFVEGRSYPVLIALPLATFFTWPLLGAKRILWAELGVFALLGLGLWARWG
jgi:hypothetical protein